MQTGLENVDELPRMRAVQIHQTGILNNENEHLKLNSIPIPAVRNDEVLIRVHYCGVCHTEIDEIENRTPPATLPMTPGHQVVGTVIRSGPDCRRKLSGARVGVAWIFSACDHCTFCQSGRENLCADFRACGRDRPGGYAEYMAVPENFVYPIPTRIAARQAAPLLCAGAVGYRALRMTAIQNSEWLGLTGFGASGQLVLKMALALFPDTPVCVFARSPKERQKALECGATWAGETAQPPPRKLQAIIDTTPAWTPVLSALECLLPGGRLIVNAIRKEAGDQSVLLQLDYSRHLWMEKSIQSVANVTREDVTEMLSLAARIELESDVIEYPLERAEEALLAIKSGDIEAASVLKVSPIDDTWNT